MGNMRDRLVGFSILTASVIGVGVYAWLLYAYALVMLQITAFVLVAFILGILAWIGYTLATTPPPAPIEDIEKELEGSGGSLDVEPAAAEEKDSE